MNPGRKEAIKAWIAAGLWIGIIATESTNWASADNTSHFLYPIFHFLTGIDVSHFSVLHPYLRKIGHFVGYFTLSVLLFGAWRATLRMPAKWALRWAAIAFFMSALVASLDEWHQTYLISRTGNFHDVLLDSFAALVAQFVIAGFIRWRRTRNGREMPMQSSPVSR